MKTLRFYPIFLLAVFTLVSCKKDDDGEPMPSVFTVTASNVQLDPGVQIDEVWLTTYTGSPENGPLAKAPFQNSGFSITFPTEVADEYMMPANDWWLPEIEPSIEVTIHIALVAVYQGEIIGSFDMTNESYDTIVRYMFATAPFTVTGSAPDYVYHINLKAGWNKYAITNWGGDPEDYTSTIPSGLVWRFTHL